MGGGCSDYVHGAVASVDTAEFVEYAAAACVVGGWDKGGRGREGIRWDEGGDGGGGCISWGYKECISWGCKGWAVGYRAYCLWTS